MERDKRKKSKMPCLFGGNGENLNRKTFQPRSQSDGITDHNLFMFEAGQTSSKQGYGTPMKTLLAKEMLNETSAKKRSPSLIAKLMGLDGLPSPQPIHKQQRKLSDNKRNEKPSSHQLNKKTTIEQQFKDVYEDPEASHAGNHRYQSPLNSKRRSTKQEMGYIQERCDEMLRESIAIKSKLERVDSNSDLMLTFLHKPDSLFVKHLHDQQGIPPGSLCNQITLLKPSNSAIHGPEKEEKETINYRHRRSSRILERKDDIALSPTRIVVLKPNLSKILNDRTSVHSPEIYKGPLGEVRSSSRHKSREAREIARQITSQMKEGFECGNIHLFHSGFRGYDDMDEFDRPRRSPMSESSVIREAKKRMSQRWKTHGYKDASMIGKGNTSTLEEMLSVPNSEMKHDIINGEHLRSTSRSRSKSAPLSYNNRSHKPCDYHEADGDLKIVVHNEPIHRFKIKGNLNHREDSRSKNVRYTKRCNACSPEFDDYLPERHCTRKQTEQESPVSNIHDRTMNSATVVEQDVGSSAVDEDSLVAQEQWSGKSGGTVSIQLSGPEPESSEGSKEVDQFGQTSSVLEVSHTDDVSSGSDCFEGVSTRLLELRKQLHLLKMESESTYDSQNEEETEQQSSFTVSESENWESIYLTDFLQGSGFYDHDTYTFMTTWYNNSQDNIPTDPTRLFDSLEKKYSEGLSVSRSERRLFHDRISEALFVISKSRVSCSWVGAEERGIQMTLTEIGFEDQLRKVLGKQEKEAMEDFEETCIDKDLDWFRAVNEIDVVGKRIAEMLVNDLVLEIVTI